MNASTLELLAMVFCIAIRSARRWGQYARPVRRSPLVDHQIELRHNGGPREQSSFPPSGTAAVRIPANAKGRTISRKAIFTVATVDNTLLLDKDFRGYVTEFIGSGIDAIALNEPDTNV